MAHEDRELIRRCLQGDRRAYAAILDRYRDPVYNYCQRMLKDPARAEDIAQEALVRTLTQLEKYDAKYSFSGWLFKIATNLCIDHLRKARRIAFSLDDELEGFDSSWRREFASPGPDPSQLVERSEDMRKINEAIGELSEPYRAILLLRHQEDLSYDEIARILELPLGTVKIRIHRAREQIRRRLSREDFI